MNFQKLIEIREDLGLKQKDIANILNITQQSYFWWENEYPVDAYLIPFLPGTLSCIIFTLLHFPIPRKRKKL